MPKIIGKILDSAGFPVTGKLAVKLTDSLIFTAAQVNELRVPIPKIFEIVEGYLDIELIESATQRTTYEFHVYTATTSTLYYEQDGTPYFGPVHEESGNTYTGSAPTPNRQLLFLETLEGQNTVFRFNAIVPIAVTVQFSSLVGQGVTSARFVDRGYYREILAGLPGVGDALNQNVYAPYSELVALQSSIAALQATVELLQITGGGAQGQGGNGGNVRLAFPSGSVIALNLDKNLTAYSQKTVTGPLTFSVASGLPLLPGGAAIVRLLADAANIPNISAFKLAIGSADYDNRAGYLNVLNFWYDGVESWVSILQQVGAIAQPTLDTTPPVLQSALLNATDFARIDLTYDELLSAVNVPALGSFTATGRTITLVTVESNTVSVTLSSPLAAASSITFAYTPPGSGKIQDLAGNAAIAFSQTVSRAGVADTTPPVLQAATLDGTTFNKIYLAYSEPLNTSAVPAIAAFTVTNKTVSAVSVVGSTLTVTLSTALAPGETVTFSYVAPTANKIQDAAGNPAANNSQSISRPQITDTVAPVLQSAVLNTAGFAQIILTYDEALNANSVPALTAFGLTNQTISSVSVSGSTVLLGLSVPFPDGASATFSYVPPATNKIQDAAGNAVLGTSQTLSRAAATLDADFRLGAMPPGFATQNLTAQSFVTGGLSMTAPAENWGKGILIGPLWNQDRPLTIYLVTSSVSTANYCGGVSVEPNNWLNNGLAADTLVGIKSSIFYKTTNVRNYTAFSTNTRIKLEFTKQGADIRVVASQWNGSAFISRTNGDFLVEGVAASLTSSRIFVDAYQNSLVVERIVN